MKQFRPIKKQVTFVLKKEQQFHSSVWLIMSNIVIVLATFHGSIPLTIFFLRDDNDVENLCLSMHFVDRGDIILMLRCSYETPVHVLCVIKV
ncbi:hypothetical protein Avbf_19131 [Armadillidium vulgare]|nr:hypothetical protein Avbf_19131 [Armadillidium vulgare]